MAAAEESKNIHERIASEQRQVRTGGGGYGGMNVPSL